MKVAYANAFYDPDAFTGRNVHVKQFTDNAIALGHDVWTWPRDRYPQAKHLPVGRLDRLRALRHMDVSTSGSKTMRQTIFILRQLRIASCAAHR